MEVKLISATPDAEKLIAYCARVSSPNQENEEITSLLKYCMEHGHWSIFEQADMTIEIITSRGISPQILRHKSFSFQEFSQRYAKVTEFERYNPRRQDTKNRQNSIDDLSADDILWYNTMMDSIESFAMSFYNEGLRRGIAKESMRFGLPLTTKTKLYMKGNLRSWIHYLQVRMAPETQKEHRDIANATLGIFCEQFPILGRLLFDTM
jgi:thymidylate synthase (FAD)